MTAEEAIKHIQTMVGVALESDDPEILRKHMEMIRDIIAKVQNGNS